MKPTRKDTGEFFRLGLLAGLCDPPAVARWADSIVAAEPSPHISFIELCISASQSASSVQSLLHDIPGQSAPELPARMLLGYASRLVSSHAFTADQMLLRLYGIANLDVYPEHMYFQLASLEDDLSRVTDGFWKTIAEVTHDITVFLKDYEPYAPSDL